ncbi:MAG TPA: DUF6179 domain-containing protein [Pseudobacteroides sp.]|uniref:DUF6179 domain-containing protein n=1 Tax=Pseudobacteroides sp. TaxID=1968840 RepID=UPI002F9332DF
MSKGIEKQYPISEENLDKANYLQSLLNEAMRLKLLSTEEIEGLRIQLAQMLAMETSSYTQGDSSSLKVETAQEIMMSIIYTLDFYLKSLPNTDECLASLKSMKIMEIYAKGKELIKTAFEQAKKLYELVGKNKISTDNYAYNDTIEALSGFFKDYNPMFAAHDSKVSIDYPLCIDNMDTCGVEYIVTYLKKLYYENEFCRRFPDESIGYLLNGYSNDNKQLLVNIFELILANSLGSALLKRSPKDLKTDKDDCIYLQTYLSSMAPDDYELAIIQASDKIIYELEISNEFLLKYIPQAVKYLSIRIKGLLELNKLSTFFIELKEKIDEADYRFEDGVSMDDELFRKVTENIRDCSKVSHKLEIIWKEVRSFRDLVDVLGADCIFGDEYDEVFSSFNDLELAMLLSEIPSDKFYKDISSNPEDYDLHMSESEKEWQTRLKAFVERLEDVHKEKIIQLRENLHGYFS